MLQPNPPPEKVHRARVACNECRRLRRKCDEASPCSACIINRTTCAYREPRIVSPEARLKNLIATVAEQGKTISALTGRLHALEEAAASQAKQPQPPKDFVAFDTAVVHKLVNGYMKHIHIIHPILSRSEIGRLVGILLENRSCASIDTALVCLMMALGEVCESRLSDRRHHESSPMSTPGMPFFSKAVSQLPGNTILHIQGNILAALYCAQFRMLPNSYGHLRTASEWIQVHLQNGTRLDSALILAFWTCSQLESEFLVLGYPSSGLSQYEDQVPPPEPQDGIQDEILNHYICDIVQSRKIRSSDMRDQLLEFNDPVSFPVTNILQARSRATYHHTLAVVYCRVLRDILNGSGNFSKGEIEKLLSDGTQALVHSVTAFQLIVGKLKLVVTNVYITAYMTSMNMMALLEIYQNPDFRPILLKFISTGSIQILLRQTADLTQLASPELSECVNNLTALAQRTGLLHTTPPDTPGSD
ncbi:hypothetical protein DL95DRAFT_393932 [Leptodontidium sp. 2 PMI_412]|nr:hypothetical protein DL95DRAFT_393932 [Leptodontidium sp. 2 PMI_412]